MAVAYVEVVEVVASRRSPEGIRMGEILEEIRREGPYTQLEIAARLGMSLPGYLGYRRGYQRVTPNTLRKWAEALGVPVAELAKRLGIGLLTDADASGLRQELAAILPDADAAELDDLARQLGTLPPADRKQVLDGWRDHLTGRLSRLGRA